MPASNAIRLFLETETSGLPGRVEVAIGTIDERLRLAPCATLVPYIPAGARLWGRSMLGVRCQETVSGAAGWSVLVPVEVKVFGHALVAARQVAAGEVPAPDSYRLQEIELTREAPGALTDPAQLGELVFARPLASGQVLRREHLRARQVVAAGEQVKVVANARGFVVSTYGKAMGAAAAGQQVRVQTESGRIVSGTARSSGIVEINL